MWVCSSHAGRKYDEVLKSLPKEQQLGSQVAIGKADYDKLFQIEKDLAPEEKYKKRRELEKPVWDAYLA